MKQFSVALALLALFITQPVAAQENVLAEIRNVTAFELKVDGFALDSDQQISIHAIGGGDRSRDVYTAAWILNKQSREVAWRLKYAKRSSYSRRLAEYSDRIVLPRGQYEVYYAALPDWSDNIESFGEFLDFLGDRIFRPSRSRREYEDLNLTISGNGQRVGNEGVERWHDELRKSAVVSLTGLWDNDHTRAGFVLEKPMELSIYALGEITDDGTFDYGWIIDAKTGRRIWQMSEQNTEHAGGATKNRLVSETLSLPAGSYAVSFVTDGSHSYRDWNAPPPFDPAFWGITIRVKDEALRKYAKPFDYKEVEEENLIAELTRLRDDEFQSRAFTLNKPTDVRIYAIGEGRDHEMFDYGWIVNAKTRRKIWTMDYGETEHAGGDNKNRLVSTVIHLDKGSYVVYFVTDGSHSYRDWNAAPPFDPERWGISLNAVSPGFSPSDVSEYKEEEDASLLARIVEVRNHERRRESFTLSKESTIRVYALGEGRDGEMFDYAWIENANTGRVVWEMTYRKTEHGGGAHKNRLFDDTITLPTGKYTVFYETDDSHSFNDWNEDPPDDPTSWGVTVTLAETGRR